MKTFDDLLWGHISRKYIEEGLIETVIKYRLKHEGRQGSSEMRDIRFSELRDIGTSEMRRTLVLTILISNSKIKDYIGKKGFCLTLSHRGRVI